MVIRHSNLLLEQLTEVEEKIQKVEKLMEELNIEYDEKLLEKIMFKYCSAMN